MDRLQLLIDLMKSYGRLGLKGWKSVTQSNRRAFQSHLKWDVVEHEYEVDSTIETQVNDESILSSKLRFIPMPYVVSDFKCAFFLPIREFVAGNPDQFSFDLFLIVNQTNCLGFRWEPSHETPSKHGYGHIQMCRRMVRKNSEPSGIPNWIPDSYPAIPISTSDPLRMFLSMTAAVHGYDRDATTTSVQGDERDFGSLLKELFPEGQIRRLYENELDSTLHTGHS